MKKTILQFIIFGLVAFLLWNIYIFINPPVRTEMAVYDTIANSVDCDGIIIRDETVIKSDASAPLESIASENDMVGKGRAVAAVYTGSVDSEAQAALKKVNARIAEITGAQGGNLSFEGDESKIESNISSRISDMIVSINNKDIRNVAILKGDLNILNDKKHNETGESTDSTAMLNELYAEKERYEALLSSSRQYLYSPKSGIYSTKIDGFEELLSGSNMNTLTVESLANILKSEPELVKSADQPVCKIADNVQWYAAVTMDSETASSLKPGQTVHIKIGDSANEYKATVSYISPEHKRKSVVCVTATEYSEEAMNNRKTKITLITEKYTGIKIPIKALRVHNGEQGVYTVTEGLMKFKKAEIIYKDNDCAVAKINNSGSGYLLIYDEIVVYAKEVGENLSIR